MPHGLHTLAQAMNDALTRAEREPDSRNRPISLYLTVNDAIQITEDSVSVATTTEVMRWYSGSTASGLDYFGVGWGGQP